MKNYIFITFALIVFLFTSCATEEVPVNPKDNKVDSETITNENFEDFMMSIDSLNATYVSTSSRGFVGSCGKKLADQGGRMVGRFLGRWLGSAIGAATANPALACIGYVGGQQIGGLVGYAAASAAAEMLLSNAGYASIPSGDMELIVDLNIKLSDVYSSDLKSRSESVEKTCDSIGYYHNYVMVRVNQNKDKYIVNGALDMELLYDDIILFFKEVGVYSEPLAMCEPLKEEMRKTSMDLALLTLQNLMDSETDNQLMDKQCDYIAHRAFATEEELKVYRDFTLSVAKKCNELSESDIHRYAKDLNKVIIESDLSQDFKKEIAVSAITTVNSSLCWQQ